MVLLILLLLAYYPFRRHDGQLMVVLMLGYAVHRFINESLRIEPSYALGADTVAVGQRGRLRRGGRRSKSSCGAPCRRGGRASSANLSRPSGAKA